MFLILFDGQTRGIVKRNVSVSKIFPPSWLESSTCTVWALWTTLTSRPSGINKKNITIYFLVKEGRKNSFFNFWKCSWSLKEGSFLAEHGQKYLWCVYGVFKKILKLFAPSQQYQYCSDHHKKFADIHFFFRGAFVTYDNCQRYTKKNCKHRFVMQLLHNPASRCHIV